MQPANGSLRLKNVGWRLDPVVKDFDSRAEKDSYQVSCTEFVLYGWGIDLQSGDRLQRKGGGSEKVAMKK